MPKILFEVDVRRRASLHSVLAEQHAERVALGEVSFELLVDDNARHMGYVLLTWVSLQSAQAFLESEESHRLVKAWPIEEVFRAIALQDIGEALEHIAAKDRGA